MRFLRDVRVVDLSTSIAGWYATKLFADCGADVISVGSEPRAPLDEFLHQSKRLVPSADGLAREFEIGWPVFATQDAKEGPRAFAEKREAVWKRQ